MTNANDLLRTIVLQFIFIIVNGFVTLDEIQNGYHSEKQAYVGQYFKETIDFGPELFCNVSRVQVGKSCVFQIYICKVCYLTGII